MIYTVTFNPSLDYIVKIDDFRLGSVNRTTDEIIFAGGKGINVSIVLKNLGYDSTALGFLAGFTGDEIERLMEKQGICADFIRVPDGISRINMKIRSNVESEINGQGPVIGKKETDGLFKRLDKLEDGDILVLAGSIPGTMPESVYMDIMHYLQKKNLKIVVDATRDLLMNVLEYKPFLVKPNNHELGEIFGVELKTRAEVIPYAKKMKEMGAVNVLVSMASEGAVLITEEGDVYESDAPKGTVVNSVGAGDSMVAGFLAGYMKSGNYKDAFKMGICTGSASAFSERLASGEDVKKLMEKYF